MSVAAPGHHSHAAPAAQSVAPATRLAGYLVEFEQVEGVYEAATQMRDAGFTRWDVHSPFPVHGLDQAMGVKPTILPVLVFCGGLTGCLLGLFLTCWTNGVELLGMPFVPANLSGYQFQISGKPYFSIPAFIPVIFELTVLFSALTAVFGMLALNNLPTFGAAVLSNARFRRVTDDRFFVYVDATDPKFDATGTRAYLKELGGSEPIRVDETVRPTSPPKWFLAAGVIATCVALIPLVVIAKARNNKSREPRIHIIQDMDNQIRYKGQMANPAFADGRAMRPEPAGAVARGDIRDIALDLHFSEGLVGVDWATTFPERVKLTDQLLARGQERFNIYCTACHGFDGRGNGTVNARNVEGRDGWATWVAPTNLTDATVRDRAHGHLFNTITNGIRNMPPYGAAIPIEDRWAIVAYVRALQRSAYASPADIPAEQRQELEAR